MMTKRRIISSIAFVLVFSIIFVFVSNVLQSKWFEQEGTNNYESFIVKEYQEREKGNIEVCVLGSSQVISGISCMELYNRYGMAAYSLGLNQQPMIASYYWLKECVKDNPVKYVILDTSMVVKDAKESFYRKNFDMLPFSVGKIQGVYEHSKTEGANGFTSYLLPVIKYHSRWDELTKTDFTTNGITSRSYLGNIINKQVVPISYESMIIDNDTPGEEAEISEETAEYFTKIIEYCKTKNIELLLIKTPKQPWNKTYHQQVAALAQKNQLEFIDFNTAAMMEKIGFDCAADMSDKMHQNVRGVDKITNYLGQYLTSHYEITDHRTDGSYTVENVEAYQIEYADAYLQTTLNAAEYFARLGDLKEEQLEIHTVLTADVQSGWQEAYTMELAASGVVLDLNDVSPKNSIKLGEDAVAFSKKGLNILVHDGTSGRTVDAVTVYYDTASGELVLYRE